MPSETDWRKQNFIEGICELTKVLETVLPCANSFHQPISGMEFVPLEIWENVVTKKWEIFVFFSCAFRHFISVCAVCDHEEREREV